jgi:phenylalanyl-tRNA synthetase beta chain
MKMSLNWINEFVDIREYMQKPEALAEILTRAGFEVESIENQARDFENVVVGLILEKDKHPNADKLSLCRVTTGEGVVHQIVCGATNHSKDDLVVVALPGALLPGGFAIKQSIIRGVDSAGMLCSLKELGLATQSEGIYLLPHEAKIGQPIAEFLNKNDIIFELKVTPNRADGLSHFGLAREVACLLGKELCNVTPNYTKNEKLISEIIKLEVTDSELCPRYTGLGVFGVKVSASPDWLKKKIEAIGLKSINNIVDVTNYVMMELGQPLHAFDLEQIQGAKIKVCKSESGEKFTTLDGTELSLSGEELVIRDGARTVALAGVVGGKNSGVSDKTQNIFLEAAFFNPLTVRKTSRAFGVNTDSSYRFARGVDAHLTLKALQHAAELIQKVASGMVSQDYFDVNTVSTKAKPISIKLSTITDRLGYEADAKLAEDYFKRLGCEFTTLGANSGAIEWQVMPPSFRFDLETEMDLIEEYARLKGYEFIPDAEPWIKSTPAAQDAQFLNIRRCVYLLSSFGFKQAMNLAFTGGKNETEFLGRRNLLRNVGLEVTDQSVKLLNPLSDDLNVMRSSLSFSLWQNALSNYRQGNEVGRLFEMGTCFSQKAEKEYLEKTHLAGIAWGQTQQLWDKRDFPLVFELKSTLENLFKTLDLKISFKSVINKGDIPDFLHRGQMTQVIFQGQSIGFLASLHPLLLEDNKIRTAMALFELDFTKVLTAMVQTKARGFKTIARFPKVERDLAFVMPNATQAGDVQAEMKKIGGAHLQNVEVFDVYQGDKLEKGQKSVTFKLSFQDANATLQEEVVNQSIESIMKGLQQKFSVHIR